MLVGYVRVSTVEQCTDLQREAVLQAGVGPHHIYEDKASGRRDDRPGLDACLKALREGDVLVVWKLDRLGRSLKNLVTTIQDLDARKVGLRVLTGQGASIDTTTPAGRLVFGIFAAFAEFERDLISERTRAGLASALRRGRKGGRKAKLSKTEIAGARARLESEPQLEMQRLADELSVSRSTLWRALRTTSPD